MHAPAFSATPQASSSPVQALYIHIPFCHRVCPYCGFFKHTPAATDMRAFVAGVVQEARLRLPQGWAPRTIYFGGGTPSMLSPKHLEDMVSGLNRHIDTSQVVEWSFEANPATFTPAKVEQWCRLGITRVSLGAQSFEPELLHLLGREHSPDQIAESVRLLREAGMPQVNLDLMFCLPGQTAQQWRHSLEAALELVPDHISTYSLTLEEGTPFATCTPPSEECEVELYELAHRLLSAGGYKHYEVSNYARDDAAKSLHNITYWRGEDYCGLGPGAYGTMHGVRYMNAADTAAYSRALAEGTLPPGTQEALSPETRRTEQLGLRLRTDEGLPLALLSPADAPTLTMLQHEGLAQVQAGERLVLTPRGMLLADEIAVQLMH